MSNDKYDAVHNGGDELPRREPFETLASWDRSARPDGTECWDERPWVSPGTPPWDGQMTPAPRKRMSAGTWIGIALAVLVTLLCGGLLLATMSAQPGEVKGLTAPQEVTAPPSADEAAEVTHAVGKTFRSGDFQYTVHAVKRGLTQAGDQYTREKAQGAFTRLDVTVENVTDGPVYFDTDLRVKVEDKTGRRFSSDSAANIVGNDGRDGWFTEINPGNEIRAFAYFDLPKDVKAVQVVVSAGMLRFEADAVVPLP
jgi:hypothetical protein